MTILMLSAKPVSRKEPGARMLKPDAIARWFSYIEKHTAATTLRIYKQIANRFYEYLPDDLTTLTLEHLENYLSSLDVSPTTYNNNLTVLKSFGRWLEDKGLPNPARKISFLRAPRKLQRMLSEDEYSKVLNVCRDDEKKIVQILGNTGLRASELLGIRASSVRDGFLYVVGKGDKQRAIPLNKTAKQILHEPKTFNLLKSLKYHNLNNLCKKLAKRAGLAESFTCHSLRRRFATQLAQNINIYQLSRLLGHSSVSTTQKYIYFSESELRNLTDCLDA